MTTMRPSYSSTVMFLPISPSPPRGSTRRTPLTSSSNLAQQALPLEHRANGRDLVLVAVHQRQAAAADVHAEQVQAGLDAHRQRRDRERAEDVLDLRVDGRAALGLVDHPAHFAADEVRARENPP